MIKEGRGGILRPAATRASCSSLWPHFRSSVRHFLMRPRIAASSVLKRETSESCSEVTATSSSCPIAANSFASSFASASFHLLFATSFSSSVMSEKVFVHHHVRSHGGLCCHNTRGSALVRLFKTQNNKVAKRPSSRVGIPRFGFVVTNPVIKAHKTALEMPI